MKRKSTLILLGFFASYFGFAQIPTGYYDNANGLIGTALHQALHDIIDNHTVISYSGLHSAYPTTDKKPNGKVWDMYSDVPGGTPPYEFTFNTDKCGTYQKEGDCYNREHSFPQSWFNESSPMVSDLYHVVPTDGYVNGKRSNYPMGEVGTASWTSQNGSLLGSCSSPGYSGTVFEPIDGYKGDFARIFFYMATRYLNEDNNWQNNAMVDGSQLKPWALNQLYQWHLQDTVSQKEINRNDAVYTYQNNRNPFVDHPEFVDSIWFFYDAIHNQKQPSFQVFAFPNPGTEVLNLHLNQAKSSQYIVEVMDLEGRIVMEVKFSGSDFKLNTADLSKGLYLIRIEDQNQGTYQTLKWIKNE